MFSTIFGHPSRKDFREVQLCLNSADYFFILENDEAGSL